MNHHPSAYLKLLLAVSLAWPAVGQAKGEERTLGAALNKPGQGPAKSTRPAPAPTVTVGEAFVPQVDARVPGFDANGKIPTVYFTAQKSIDGGWEVYSLRQNRPVFGSWHRGQGIKWNGTNTFVTKNVEIPTAGRFDRLKLLYKRRVPSPGMRQQAPEVPQIPPVEAPVAGVPATPVTDAPSTAPAAPIETPVKPPTSEILARAKAQAEARRDQRARSAARAEANPAPAPAAADTSAPAPTSTPARVEAVGSDSYVLAPPIKAPEPDLTTAQINGAKPSQWRKLMKIDASSAKELGLKAARQGKRGLKGLYDLAMPENQAGNTALNMNSLPAASIAFAAALGGAAAIKTALNSATNPIALDQYYDQMHDEITWLSLGGMVITTNYFLTKPFFSPTSGAPLWQKAAGFGAVLGVGTLISTPMMAFANDPDIKACISAENYHKTGNPFDNSRAFPSKQRDYQACDRAFAKKHLRQIAQSVFVDQFLPTAATMIVSGSIYYALLYGAGKLVTASKVLASLGRATTALTGSGAILQLGVSIGAQLLLLSVIDKPLQWTWQKWADYRAASFTYQSGLYAETPERAETALFTAWAQAKASGWTDPSDVTAVKDVCYDENRVGSKYFDCARKKDADFEGALASYHAQQAKWRESRLSAVKQAYEQWKEKVTSYHQLFQYTESFYKEAVDKIIYTIRNPDAPATDPMVFNLQNMKINVHTPYIPDGLRSSFLQMARIDSFDGNWGALFYNSRWQYLSTPDVSEFLLASLACGPEIEGSEMPSMLDRGVRFLQEWVYGGAPPREVFINAKGHKVVFNPPRITDSIAGGHSVCEYTRSAGAWASWVKGNVNTFEVRTAKKTYVGLFSYIVDHVRGSVVAPDQTVDQNRLQWWWQNLVKRQDEVINGQLAEEYQEVVEKMFDPAVLNTEYYWCGAHEATRGSKLEEYMRRLTRADEACGSSSTHRLANGVLNNLRDQSRLYIAMMMDLYVSNPKVFGADPNQSESTRAEGALASARTLFAAYDRFSVEYVRRSNPEGMKQALRGMAQAYKNFLALVQPSSSAPGFQSEWMDTLGNDLNESLAGLTAYVQLTSLPRVANGQ